MFSNIRMRVSEDGEIDGNSSKFTHTIAIERKIVKWVYGTRAQFHCRTFYNNLELTIGVGLRRRIWRTQPLSDYLVDAIFGMDP